MSHKDNEFDCFLSKEAQAINKARLDHLDTLGFTWKERSVLEVGCGIGLHTGFFLDRGCTVLSIDGRARNINYIHEHYPDYKVRWYDLDQIDRWQDLLASDGGYDYCYCYGTLYHLQYPEYVLFRLSELANIIIIETIVDSETQEFAIRFQKERQGADQSYSGVGCRPSREWVMNHLHRFWGHAYTTTTQPDHPEFPTDWNVAAKPFMGLHRRAIFVGSYIPLHYPSLTYELPAYQRKWNG